MSASFTDVPDMALARFDAGTIFNQWTAFPLGFNPLAAGLSFQRSREGDWDASGTLDAVDLDLMYQKIDKPYLFEWLEDAFDRNKDSRIDRDDIRIWIRDLKVTYTGDADLDGEFSSRDFVQVFRSGKYESPDEAGWSEGDWNLDGHFTSSDFVVAFAEGGYEQGPRTNAMAVPEPSQLLTWAFAIPWLIVGLRRQFNTGRGHS